MNTLSEEERKDTPNALHEALERGDYSAARLILDELHPSEIADIIENSPNKKRNDVWNLIDSKLEGDVLSHAQDVVRSELLEQMKPHEVLNITRDLETDDIADILQDLPKPVTETVLLAMDKQNRKRLSSVLTYAEDTAGGLMSLDVISVRADVNLDVVLRYMRLIGKIPEGTDNIMVVDRDNNYLGVLHLTDLLIRDADTTVGEWTEEAPCLSANTPASDVANLFERRDLVSAAVVDDNNLLLGRITIDDVVDVIKADADEVVNKMAGIKNKEDMFSPVLITTKHRSIWLGINLLTVFLGSWVIGRFEDTIEQLVALAVLLPIVSGMGGIAGSQTLTITIRGISQGKLDRNNIMPLFFKESSVGLLNGAIWSFIVSIIVYIWFSNLELGMVIGAAMFLNLVIAALSGVLIPFFLKHIGIDPAIAGGVILTTVTDIIGFVTFLGLSTILLLG